MVIGPAQPQDLSAIEALLVEGDLHLDVCRRLGHLLVARHQGSAAGCIGMEVYGRDALFRSLAVTPAYRGMGLAHRLCKGLVERAVAQGVREAYLLTKTIAPLAEVWGFQRFDRAGARLAIRETTEFRGACCASAMAMRRDLLA